MKNKAGDLLFAVLMSVGLSQTSSATDTKQHSAALVGQFKKELKSELLSAINKGGAASAVSVCAEQAPLIASRLSRTHGVKLQRVSDRTRNPLNEASESQASILEFFANNPYGSNVYFDDSRDGVSVYAEAIRTDGLCLSCHGTDLAPEVSNQLQASYPFDTATGYSLGELRGMFSVERQISSEDSSAIRNLAMISKELWVGGQPSEEQIAQLKTQGIATVINLRTTDESSFNEAEAVRQLGLQYESLPIAGAKDITFSNSQRLRAILDKTKGPVFLHCGSSNRAGALLALDAYKNGLDRANAINLGTLAGMSSLLPAVEAEIDSSNVNGQQESAQ